MKVAALTSGLNTPSARFRIRQYIPALAARDVHVTDHCPAVAQGARLPGVLGRVRMRYIPPLMVGQSLFNLALRAPGIAAGWQADVTWLERNFVPGMDDLAVLLKRPLVLDIDDAIWLYNPFGASMIKRLVGRANMVFAGNGFLAEWCSQYCSEVRVIPTAIDTSRFRPDAASSNDGGRFVIGWTGTSGNFRFLHDIEPALAAFLHAHKDARFLVVADKAPDFSLLPADRCEFVRWSPDNEHRILSQMDVGIMPIDDSDLSRGKCSFKMLQYMSAGLPVIVSPYGMNAEILGMADVGFGAKNKDEWIAALEACRDTAVRMRLGGAGRQLVESHFSTESVAASIGNSFLALGAG